MINKELTKEKKELIENEIINKITKELRRYEKDFVIYPNEFPPYIVINEDIKLKYNKEESYRTGKNVYNPVFNIKEQRIVINLKV